MRLTKCAVTVALLLLIVLFASPSAQATPLAITGPSSPLPPATVQIAYAPQTFAATGGTGSYTWAQTGLPAFTGLSLSAAGVLGGTPAIGSQGLYTLTVTLTDSSGGNTAAQFQISILNPPIFVSPLSLNFTYQAGGSVSVPAQTFSVFSKGSPMKYTASSSAAWLNAVTGTGQTPDSVTLTLQDLSTLPQCPGPAACGHTATVTVTPFNGSANAVSVSAVLSVVPLQPVLSVSPQDLTVSAVAGGRPAARRVVVSNAGGQTINYTVSAGGPSWLTVSCGSAGAVTLASPGSMCLTFDPGALEAGVYHTPLVISGGPGIQPVTMNVTLRVAQSAPLILISPAALEFSALFGGVSPPGQPLSVFNVGAGTMNWSAQSGVSWLHLSSTGSCANSSQTVTGAATNGSAIGALTACVTSSQLPLGESYGRITVTTPDGTAVNSAALTVLVNILPGGTTLPEAIGPTGVVLQSTAGSATLATSPVKITNFNDSAVNYSAIYITQDGANWLSSDQNTGYVAGGSTVTLQMRANAAALAPGVYHGQVRLAITDGANAVVNVILVVSAATGTAETSAAARRSPVRPRTSPPNCPGGTLLPPQLITLTQQGFQVQAGTVQQILAQVKDSCGNPITDTDSGISMGVLIYNPETLVTFESPYLVYNAALSAWQYAWTPATSEVGPLAIAAVAWLDSSGSSFGSRSDVWVGTVTGALPGAAAEPLVAINAASPNVDGVFQANQVAAGSYIAIYGAMLADGVDKPYPFPALDQGATVTLGGVPLMLEYISPSQINALVPTAAGLPLNAPLPLAIQRDGTFSTADIQVSVTQVQPAVFILSQYSQGAVLIANTPDVAAPVGFLPGSRPAKAGADYLEIYCNGLGPVNNPPADGQPAGSPAPQTIATPTVTISGINAPVLFSGLSPGSVALYQIDVQVPAGSQIGNVPLTVSVGGVLSNTVYVAVD